MRVCVQSHVWYISDLQVYVGVSVFSSAYEIRANGKRLFFFILKVNQVFCK